MMTLREELGQRIKSQRIHKQLTQGEFCGDEEKLTIRQLQRIEAGQSLPSLEKLEFIANRLEVSLSALLEGNDIRLPDDYWERKSQIVKFPTYGEKDKIQQKLQLIEELYEEYFDLLPEDELLFLDLSENILDIYREKELPSIEEMYEDAFEQILKKDSLALNDYLYVSYFIQQYLRNKQKDFEKLQQLGRKLLNQDITADELYNIELLISIGELAYIYICQARYPEVLHLLEKSYQIIDKTQLHTYKIGFLELEAKYYVEGIKDKNRAKILYHQALSMAEILGQSAAIEDIKAEMAKDGIE